MKITYTVCVSHIFYLSIIPILCEVFGRLLLILYTWVFPVFPVFQWFCYFKSELSATLDVFFDILEWSAVFYLPEKVKHLLLIHLITARHLAEWSFFFPEWVLDFLTFVTSNQVSLNLLSLIKTWIKLHLYKNKYVSTM